MNEKVTKALWKIAGNPRQVLGISPTVGALVKLSEQVAGLVNSATTAKSQNNTGAENPNTDVEALEAELKKARENDHVYWKRTVAYPTAALAVTHGVAPGAWALGKTIFSKKPLVSEFYKQKQAELELFNDLSGKVSTAEVGPRIIKDPKLLDNINAYRTKPNSELRRQINKAMIKMPYTMDAKGRLLTKPGAPLNTPEALGTDRFNAFFINAGHKVKDPIVRFGQNFKQTYNETPFLRSKVVKWGVPAGALIMGAIQDGIDTYRSNQLVNELRDQLNNATYQPRARKYAPRNDSNAESDRYKSSK